MTWPRRPASARRTHEVLADTIVKGLVDLTPGDMVVRADDRWQPARPGRCSRNTAACSRSSSTRRKPPTTAVAGGLTISFPRSAWERTSGRSASRAEPWRATDALGSGLTGRGASGRAFPRGAWERGARERGARGLRHSDGNRRTIFMRAESVLPRRLVMIPLASLLLTLVCVAPLAARRQDAAGRSRAEVR